MLGDHKEVYAASEVGHIAGYVVLRLGGQLRGYIQTIVCSGIQEQANRNGPPCISEERNLKEFPNVFMRVLF